MPYFYRLSAFVFFVCLIPELIFSEENKFPTPQYEINPEEYICRYTDNKIQIDGNVNEDEWAETKWSNSFVDIEGDLKPAPQFDTKIKMLWNSEYLFIAANMEEPHIWAKLTERDDIIFYDNDFEVFIDPNGDTHEYYELEMNALNTVWDLYIVKPYRDGGPAVHNWDINGLKTAVSIDGTLNDPQDIDNGWSAEIAIPWNVLAESAHQPCPPESGDVWRINFSRVEWDTEIINGNYEKVKDENGNVLPERNWVWSPQGLINMHYPEQWGFLKFVSGNEDVSFKETINENCIKDVLRKIYYSQKTYYEQKACYADNISDLSINVDAKGLDFYNPQLFITPSTFEVVIKLPNTQKCWHIDHEGKTWKD